MTTRTSVSRIGRVTVATLVTALAVSVAAGTSSAAPSASNQSVNLAPTKTYLLSHTAKLRGFTTRFQAQANRYFALAKAADFDYAALWATEARCHHAAARPLEGSLDRGQPVLRARRGRRRRNAVARRLRRDPRRRLERAGGPGERRAVRPPPRRRPRAPQARKPLQPHRGHALGHPPRVHGEGRQGRPRRRREARVRRGAPRCGRVQGVGRGVRAVRREARPLVEGVEADGLRRVHRRRRDGADDERVLRPVEGVALRPRRPRAGRLVQRRLAPLGHRRHPRRAPRHLRGDPTGDRDGRPASRRRRRSASSTASGPTSPSCGRRSGPDAGSRPSRRTRSVARRKGARRRSPAR